MPKIQLNPIVLRYLDYAYVHKEQFILILKQSTKLFLSTITYSFYDALFAPLLKGVELDVAKAYITKLTRFYNDGILAGIK